MDSKKEMEEIIGMIKMIKNRMGSLSVAMEEADQDTESVDEAMVSLDDAIDILTDELMGE